jgi:hypothetical protein
MQVLFRDKADDLIPVNLLVKVDSSFVGLGKGDSDK